MKELVKAADKVLEWIFPSSLYCISCGSIIDSTREYGLCDNCMSLYRFANGRTCEKCGKLLADDYKQPLCYQCRENDFCFEQAFCCVQYGMHEKKPVLHLKYGDQPYIAQKIGHIMYDRLACEDIVFQAIIPVPVHALKLRSRGYNQAELIASALSRRMNITMLDVLERIKASAPMSKLSLLERLGNTEGIFALKNGMEEVVKGKSVLLVDDIMTTGSTADNCSRVLLDAGAARVYIIVFAAGANSRVYTDEDDELINN